MNTWDFFDTLIARRCVEPFTDYCDPQMEREAREFIPIRENIMQVLEDDIIVSDMYLPHEFLLAQCKKVTGLQNEFIVGNNIKGSGAAWADLRKRGLNPVAHFDDARYCLEAAEHARLVPIECRQSDLTAVEKEIRPTFPGFAKAMREARLGTFNAGFRDLELLQIQDNAAMFFFASIRLHRRMKGLRQVLMSSRNCCLWMKMQRAVRDLLGGKYNIEYFYTSRDARINGGITYLQYVNGLLMLPSLIVDVAGTGATIPMLLKRTMLPDTPWLLLCHYESERRPAEAFIDGGTNLVERANLALHAKVVSTSSEGAPVYANASNIGWASMTTTLVQHAAFDAVLSAMKHYDFSVDLTASDESVQSALEASHMRLESTTALEFLLPLVRHTIRTGQVPTV